MSYTVEREVYSAPTIERKTMRKLEDWKAFARMFRARIKKETARFQLEIVAWNNGHSYCSGFVKNKITGKFAYFSVSDVRHFRNGWSVRMIFLSVPRNMIETTRAAQTAKQPLKRLAGSWKL